MDKYVEEIQDKHVVYISRHVLHGDKQETHFVFDVERTWVEGHFYTQMLRDYTNKYELFVNKLIEHDRHE